MLCEMKVFFRQAGSLNNFNQGDRRPSVSLSPALTKWWFSMGEWSLYRSCEGGACSEGTWLVDRLDSRHHQQQGHV